MTRSEESADRVTRGSVEGVVGDMDRPETLVPLVDRAERIFLVSPMSPSIAAREQAVIAAATKADVRHVVKLYGAVVHDGDPLDEQHQAVISALRECGLPWTLVSPQTVMETNLIGQAEQIRAEGRMYGSAGDGRLGIVAADDCARAAAVVLSSDVADYTGRNLKITGPEALTFTDIAACMSRALGRQIEYIDMSESEFAEGLIAAGYPEADLDMQILCHFRQMRNGNAELVTDTFREVVGEDPTSMEAWGIANASLFEAE
jgi:uncharacterized protein YbjT (DUF2867 family)